MVNKTLIFRLFFVLVTFLCNRAYSQVDLGSLRPYSLFVQGDFTDNNRLSTNGFIGVMGNYSGSYADDDTVGEVNALSELNSQLQTLNSDLLNLPNQSELEPPYDYMIINPGVYGSPDFILEEGYSVVLSGSSDDQIVINIVGDLIISSNAQIILEGIKSENIIWNINGNVYLNENSIFYGVIISTNNIETQNNVGGSFATLGLGNITLEETNALVSQAYMGNMVDIVPNGSFFNPFPACPQQLGLIGIDPDASYAKPWRNPVIGGSPDYYHMCASYPTYPTGVPNNFNGSQPPIGNGVGYAGIIAYLDGGYTEYLHNKLSSNLVSGKTYLVRVMVSLADKSSRSVSDLGVYFSSSAILQNSSIDGFYLNYTPQIKNYCTIVNKSIWYPIQSYYTATGNEEYITIGRFNDGNMLPVIDVSNSPNTHSTPVAHFYVGQVSITEVVGTPLPLNPSTNITANAGPDKSVCTNGHPVSIGGQLSNDCLPNATFSWSPTTGLSASNISNPTAFPSATTTYTLTVVSGNLTTTDQVTVNVIPPVIFGTEINPETQYIPSGISTTVNTRYNVTGGSGPITYYWIASSPATLAALSNTTSPNPNILINTPGTYSYILVAVSGGCEYSFNRTFIVLAPPTAPNYTLSSGNCDLGTSNNLHVASPLNPTYYTYSWDFGNGNTYTGTSIYHNFNAGIYPFTLTITDAWGRFATKSDFLNIMPSYSSYNSNCCSESNSLYEIGSVDDVIINSTQSLSFNYNRYKKSIIVKSPYTLTISNSILQFGLEGKIIVEPGATLIVENSTLKGLTSCGTMWQGIEVWGNSSQAQSTTYQGKLVISGTSQINDAHKAIFVGKRNTCFDLIDTDPETCPINNPEYESGFGGGIINVQGATFNRNAIDIQFSPYNPTTSQPTNPMVIKGNNFAGGTLLDPRYNTQNSVGAIVLPNANNLYYAPANSLGRSSRHIKIYGVKNDLDFQDNIFDHAEYGIDAIDAQFNVTKNTATNGNEFKNMNYGIYINNTVPSAYYPHSIIENSFNKLNIAIEIQSGRYDVIKKNTFGRSISPESSQTDNPYGIYFNNTAAFHITDNNFYRVGVGVQIEESGDIGGWIDSDPEGNVFTRCNYGVVTTEDNNNLQIRCGKFINSEPAEYFQRNWDVFGDLPDQGGTTDYKAPAGNEFLTSTAKHIYSTTSFTYNRHKWGVGGSTDLSVLPVVATGSSSISINNTGYAKNNYSCSSEDPCNPCGRAIEDNSSEKTQIEEDYESMLLVLDNNNTSVLLNELNNFSLNSEQLKELLIENSPLSDLVMASLIDNYTKLTQTHFVNVMEYNLPMNEELWTSMQYLLPAFTSNHANYIVDKQFNENLHPTLSSLERKYIKTINKRQTLIAQAVKLELDTNENLAMNRLLPEENENKQLAVGTYLSKGNTGAASMYLSGMNTSENEDADWVELQNINVSLQNQSKNWFAIDSTQQATIRRIASGKGLAAANAKAILHLVFNEEFPIPTRSNINTYSRKSKNKLSQPKLFNEDKLLGVYPNPSSTVLNIPYKISDQAGSIEIRNILGEIIHSTTANKGYNLITLDVSNYTVGIYFVTLKSANGESISTQKVTVQH